MSWLANIAGAFRLSLPLIGILAYFGSHIAELQLDWKFSNDYHQNISYLLGAGVLYVLGDRLLPLLERAIKIIQLLRNGGDLKRSIEEVLIDRIFNLYERKKISTEDFQSLIQVFKTENQHGK